MMTTSSNHVYNVIVLGSPPQSLVVAIYVSQPSVSALYRIFRKLVGLLGFQLDHTTTLYEDLDELKQGSARRQTTNDPCWYHKYAD